MKHNGKNIITDQDITLTGNDFAGKTLDTVLTDQEERLDRVESNVKWIYKYGGVGSGSGGSGSGSSNTWTVLVERVEDNFSARLKDGDVMNLHGPGKYGISIKVVRGGSDVFKVEYSYRAAAGNRSSSFQLNANNDFFSTIYLDLDTNDTLNIKVTNVSNPDDLPITFTIPYIVSSYSFKLDYVYEDTHEPFIEHSGNSIFMSRVKNRGLMAALTYSLAVDAISASYTYTDWEGNTVTVNSSDENGIKSRSKGTIYIPLCENSREYLSDNDNARFRQFNLDIDLTLEGQIDKENIGRLSLKDTLIPAGLFLKVTASGGTIYDAIPSSAIDSSDQFIAGTIVFNVTPFFDAIQPGRTFNFSVFLDDVKLGQEEGVTVTTLLDQQAQAITIPAPEAKRYKITFSVVSTREQETYTIDYWFFTKEAISDFYFYPSRMDESGISSIIHPVCSDVYRKSREAFNIEGVTASKSLNITSVSDDITTYNFESENLLSYQDYDQLICLGFQYVRTNDTTRPIARFNISGGPVGDIYIYQDKIVINKDAQVSDVTKVSGDECEIYFPMCKKLEDGNGENYHLLTIYKRFEKSETTNNWKGIYVFIDGDLEGAFTNFSSIHNQYTSISLFPGNYYINLIENSCFAHSSTDTYHRYLDDIDIKGYFYAYKCLLLGGTVDEDTKQLYDNFSTFKIDEENFILADDRSVVNIAEHSEIPVLVMHYTDTDIDEGVNGNRQRDLGFIDVFRVFMSKSYDENSVIVPAPINISYSPGKARPEYIQRNGSIAVFSAKPQGSSTLGFRGKNWEVYAPSSGEDGVICVYTPNFKEGDTTTFLPEESFTIKADIVDSSHTNNNAIAGFVNDVTQAFGAARLGQKSPVTGRDSAYIGYIKNCLSGFPILLFLHTTYRSDENSGLDTEKWYFLGIHNFNLGRNSWFNLGYRNTGILETVGLQNGFGIYDIPQSSAGLLTGVMVGEIQSNNSYFDFSQYDPSVLFKSERYDNDEKYMWGDFVGDANTKSKIATFVQKVARAGGYIFDTIGKLHTTDDPNHGYDQEYSVVNQVPDYTWQAVRNPALLNRPGEYTFSQKSAATMNELVDFLITDENDPTIAKGIDYNSLCEYYTICMAFGMVDSVQKNLNIKSWDGGKEFYLAFYDMDTCLGVSNSGSKISYFAFSDYWDWKNSIDEDKTLTEINILRDYAPKGDDLENVGVGAESFYDVPSSYLFAIAKYAYFVLADALTDDQVSTLKGHPNNLWSKWRKLGGPLENSKVFIDKYYRNHLAGVPEVAFNYNYRYKYFVKSDSGQSFDNINFPKFYGRKIAYTETWLDNRLHILDAYFNIRKHASVLEPSLIPAPSRTENAYDPGANTDVYILHDIFSGDSTEGLQYSNAASILEVKAKAYAPLICKLPGPSSQYMFTNDENMWTKFQFKTNGMQAYLFGGSALWTEIESINPFLLYGTTNSFQVSSEYLSKITGTTGTCNSWYFDTPSLKEVSLTNKTDVPTYSGEITFNGLESYPNLKSIKIDGTAIVLNVSNSNIVSVSALGMKEGASVTINNTPNIASILVSGNLGDLTLPGWGTDIMIPGDGSTINSGRITVQNLKYPGATIRICNAPNLIELNLTGFQKVIVDNCPRLNKIIFGEVENIEDFGLRVLDVTYPVVSDTSTITLSDKLTIGPAGTAENTVDLSMWGINFEALRLRHCPIEKVDVPDGCDINLLPYAFWESRKLRYLNGDSTFWIHSSENYTEDPGNQISGTGAETFHNAIRFTMKQDEDHGNAQVDLRVHENCTNLENTFCIDYNLLGGQGDIHLEQAQYFLSTGSEKAYNVTSVAYLFRGQHIEYGKRLFLDEYNAGTCSIGFSKYPKCNRFSYAFRDTWVRCYNRYMFAGLGSEIGTTGLLAGYTFSQVVYVTSNPAMESMTVDGRTVSDYVLYATTDFLEEIIDRIYELNMTEMSDGGNRLCFLDPSDDSILPTLVVRDIFCPHNKTPEKLGYIRNMEFFKGHTLNMTDAFRWDTTTPLVLNRFMSTVDYQFFVDGSLEKLFYYTNIYSIEYSLSNLYGYPSEVNIANFISWEDVGNVSKLFYESTGTYSLGFNKRVSYRDFQNTVWYNILRTPPLNMGCIFQDCTIYFQPGQESEDFSLVSPENAATTVPNETITDISFLFSSMRAKVDGTLTYAPLKMTSDFLKYLPKIKKAKAAFRNTFWANPIPWDFFNKQEEVLGRSVYVKNSQDEFISATLIGSEYRKELQDINECFASIKLNGNIAWDPGASYNRRREPWTIEGEDGVFYDSYYETPGGEEIINWPWIDSLEVVECALPPEAPWIPSNVGVEWSNPVISNAGKGLFVSPDIFSACATGCNVTSCFSASSYTNDKNQEVFTGVIPNHLVWPLGKSSDLSNIMSNLNILPRLYGTHATEEVLNKYYYFVPSNYTTRVSLDNAFNFKMLLPKENRKVGSNTEKDLYYILLSDSLPKNIESLNSSFPSASTVISQQWAWNGTYYVIDPEHPEIKARQDGIYYSIMGTPTYSDNNFVGMSTGIPLEYYDTLKADGLVQASLAAIISGRIFAEDYYTWTIRNNLNNSSNSAIYLSSSGLSFGAEVYMPVKNNQFMTTSSACFIHKESILNFNETEIDPPGSNKLKYYPNISIIGTT